MKRIIGVLLAIALLANFAGVASLAVEQKVDQELKLLYEHTLLINLTLDISGSLAKCNGFVTPYSDLNTSIVIRLYEQTLSGWVHLASWYGSATHGATAEAGGSYFVTSGTYKATLNANVGGLEFPSTSVTKTK